LQGRKSLISRFFAIKKITKLSANIVAFLDDPPFRILNLLSTALPNDYR
jgi:hypothetical protein